MECIQTDTRVCVHGIYVNELCCASWMKSVEKKKNALWLCQLRWGGLRSTAVGIQVEVEEEEESKRFSKVLSP